MCGPFKNCNFYFSSGEQANHYVVDKLEVWKRRAKTAEARADYYKNLAAERDKAMKPFLDAFMSSQLTGRLDHQKVFMECIEKITEKEKHELLRVHVLDKTEGD